jgi:hypothetical protein
MNSPTPSVSTPSASSPRAGTPFNRRAGQGRRRRPQRTHRAGRHRHRRPRHLRPGLFPGGTRRAVRGHLRREGRRAARRSRRWPTTNTATQDCAMYRDLRELLARSDIDAVLIATGPNWHATAAMPRRQCRQGRVLREALHQEHRAKPRAGRDVPPHRRVFQAGTQRRSLPNFAFAIELARRASSAKSKRFTPTRRVGRPSSAAGCRPNPSRTRSRWTGTFTSAPRLAAVQQALCWTGSTSRKAAASWAR